MTTCLPMINQSIRTPLCATGALNTVEPTDGKVRPALLSSTVATLYCGSES